MLLFISFVCLVIGQDEDCSLRTKTFKNRVNRQPIQYYFGPQSYGLGDKCEPTTIDCFSASMRSVVCYGKWCIKGSKTGDWGCELSSVSSPFCYKPTMIIPNNNITELAGCNHDIQGNMIMAYGVWANELGNGSWGEREIIFGDIYYSAYAAVYECCKKKPRTDPQGILCASTGSYVTITGVIFGILCVCLVCISGFMGAYSL